MIRSLKWEVLNVPFLGKSGERLSLADVTVMFNANEFNRIDYAITNDNARCQCNATMIREDGAP